MDLAGSKLCAVAGDGFGLKVRHVLFGQMQAYRKKSPGQRTVSNFFGVRHAFDLDQSVSHRVSLSHGAVAVRHKRLVRRESHISYRCETRFLARAYLAREFTIG